MSLVEQKARVTELLVGTKDKKNAAAALGELLEFAAKPNLESLLVEALPQIIEAIGDKQKTTQAAASQVRPAGAGAARALGSLVLSAPA